MKIMKTSVMHTVTSYDYNTIKVISSDILDIVRDFYGDDAEQKLRGSGLYEDYDEGGLAIYSLNLSANIFEAMPSVVTEEELQEYTITYFRENEMWPMEKPIAEIHRYTMDVALPLFVKAGLLETA